MAKHNSATQELAHRKEKRNQFPDWYWPYGLRDAQIKAVNAQELSLGKNNRYYNKMIIDIDPDCIAFGERVTRIILYNYKTDCSVADCLSLCSSWWLRDVLTKDGGKYSLSIDLETESRKKRVFNVTFDFAEKITAK